MKNMEGVEVVGTFNTQAWFSTLAAIMSRKYEKNVTAKVAEPEEDRQNAEKASA